MEAALHEALREVAARPASFAAEIVQFVVLVVVVAWAARRPIAARLAKRRDRIAADLAGAAEADREAEGMRAEVEGVVARAEAEARALVEAARARATAERDAADVASRAEAERVLAQARDTVEAERRRVLQEASERLVRLTSETARRYLEEMLTEGERRAVTEKAILDSLRRMERAEGGRRSG